MSEERFDPGLKYIGTGEYVPVMEWSAEGEYVRHSCIANLEKKLAERDAALARCVDVIDVEPELPGDIPDEIWYRLKLQVDAGDRLGVSGTLRGVVRATKKAIHQRVALSIPASAQATAKVQQWQPIETAPKDKEVMLSDGSRVTQGFWYEEEHGEYLGDCGGPCRCPEYDAPCEPFWMSMDGGFTRENPPTHWMPLPEPPIEAIREEKEGE